MGQCERQKHKTICKWSQGLTCIVMQEASDAHSKTADSDTVSTYQVSSVQIHQVDLV